MFRASSVLILGLLATAAACGDDEAGSQPFEIKFAAQAAGSPVTCATPVTGLGPQGAHSIGVSDLRFYVSNLVLFGDDGKPLQAELDDNDFQYNSAAGSVALIDLTGNTEGSCAGSAIAFAEGTARTSDRLTGRAGGEVHAISFDVGVPAAVMKETIATNSPEGAPSPLAEMYWSWASGYRHLVMNFTVRAPGGQTGEGYLHIGSRDCGAAGKKALEDRDQCGRVNTAKVMFPHFHPENNTVVLDVAALLSGLDMISTIYDPVTFDPIGEGPGAECHSMPEGQPDCPIVFNKLGIDQATGNADALSNRVFVAK
jgi:uncharacterized repeat protein (TIGR04052 family)